MKLSKGLGQSILICFLSVMSPLLQAETVKLTSLEWPPYTSESLEAQGASVAVATAAFEAMGYQLVVDFYPWKRAVGLAKNSPKYDGYFPEYYAAELENDFVLSEPMGSGPLGFAERTDNPISWETLTDLKRIKIGVVSGYVNTTKFDAMVADKTLTAKAASDDVKNLLKLAAGRVDLAVVDTYVMQYLLATDSKLKAHRGTLQFNTRPLEDKKLYICFKKNDRGRKLAGVVNQGLKKIDVKAIMQSHFSKLQ